MRSRAMAPLHAKRARIRSRSWWRRSDDESPAAPRSLRLFGTPVRRDSLAIDVAHDRPRESEPAGLAMTAEMVKARAARKLREPAADERRRRCGERPAPVRDSALIRDDAQLVSLRG